MSAGQRHTLIKWVLGMTPKQNRKLSA